MRIQYIITGKRHKDDMNSTNIHFMTLLQEYICKYDYVDIVDHAPDIAHVCGNWNIETIRQIKKIIQNEIPVIFTSCNGLNDFSGNIQRYQSLIMRDLIRNVSAIHVCGIIEKEKIQHVCPDSCIYVVSNPVISNTTDANNMTSLMLKTYNSIINNYNPITDENTPEEIEIGSGVVSNIILNDSAWVILDDKETIEKIKLGDMVRIRKQDK